jgi:hypothetical protein
MRSLSIALGGALLTLVAPAFAVADEFNITAAEHAACDADAERLCLSAYPDVSRMINCMVVNRPRLTPLCRVTFDEGLRKRHIRVPDLSASR